MNAESVICRLCLVADVQMFNLNNDNLRSCYFNLTGVKNLGWCPYICYECLALLKRFGNFRSKCLAADLIVKNVVINHIKNIDRELIGLTSTLRLTNHITVTINPSAGLKSRTVTIDLSDDEIYLEPDIKDKIKTKTIDCANICNDEQKELQADFDKILDLDDHKTPGVDFEKHLDVDFEKHLDEDFVENLDADFDEELHANLDENSDVSVSSFEEINPDANVKLELKSETKKKVTRRNERNLNNFDYSRIATVTLLSPEEARKVVEELKETSNLRSTYKCSFCYRGYYIQARLDRHVRKIHNSKRNLECDYCHRRYNRRERLRTHFEACHTWKFQCNTCSHVCYDKFLARKHAKKHNEKKHTCNICSLTFPSLKSLLTHKRMKHASNVIPCAICGDTFSSDRGVKIHNHVVHKGETIESNGPHCDVCDVRFATDVAWKRHFVLSDKHEDITCGCETCGEIFENRKQMREHAKKFGHLRNMNRTRWPVYCIFCKHILHNKDEYRSHIRDFHPNASCQSRGKRGAIGSSTTASAQTRRKLARDSAIPLVCELCGKQFKSLCYLEFHHQVKHRDERPFKCRSCAKTFTNSGACSVHEGMHASVEERTCQLCGKVLKYKHNVERHFKRVHLAARPHKCPMCDRTFPSPCEVKNHVTYTHNKIPWPKPNRSKPRNRNKLEKTGEV